MGQPTPEGEKDMVASVIATCIKQIEPLLEGQFLEGFEVEFELDGERYILELKKITS